jgi:hypothetical protein
MAHYNIPVVFGVVAEDFEAAVANLDEILPGMPQWRDGVETVEIDRTPPYDEEPDPEPEPEPVDQTKDTSVPGTVINAVTGEPYEF